MSEIIVTNLAMHGAAIWVSPEIDDGLPPTSSNSIEAFPSAEATNLQRSDNIYHNSTHFKISQEVTNKMVANV